MPIVKTPIKEQHKSIIRPVVIDVVNDLIRFMNLPAKTEIIFNGHSDIAMLPNGMIGVQARNPQDNIRTVGRNRIFVDFEETAPETTLLEMPVFYPEQSCIFADNEIGITVRPIKERTSIRLQFTNRFTSRAQADQWQATMKQLMALLVKDYVHEVTYNYAYPDELIQLLYKLWGYREYQGGYNESFATYFRENSTQKLTAIANQDGSKTDLVIAETMSNVQGNWDFDTPPFPTKANALGSWQAEFSYIFEFDKVISMASYYPIVIHNRVLTADMIPPRRLPSYRGKDYKKPLQQDRFEGISEEIGQTYDPRLTSWLMYPDFDDWQLPQFDAKYATQYQALLTLDPENLTDVVNLKELGPYTFTPRTIAYLKHVGVKCFHHHQSIIQLALFEGDDIVNPDNILFDPLTMNVSTTYPLDIRNQYRLVVYIDSDLRRLWEQTVADLKDRGVWTQEVVRMLWVDKVPAIDEEGRVTDDEWRKLIDGIDWNKLPSTETLTIGRFIITARSERDGYR